MADANPANTICPTRPTWVRWRIEMLLMAFSAMCHFNRISMSVAGSEKLIKDYGIDPTVMGWVYSSYLIAYTVCMTPGGWLIDSWGPRRAFLFLGFGSAIFVGMTGLAGICFSSATLLVFAYFVIRPLTGIVNAPMHPGAARVVSFWIPTPARSMANGLITGAALIGIASTYKVFGFLMDHFQWSFAFVIAGMATGILAVLWFFYATNKPREHKSVNSSELKLIETDKAIDSER
jgi:MFS family permease